MLFLKISLPDKTKNNTTSNENLDALRVTMFYTEKW